LIYKEEQQVKWLRLDTDQGQLHGGKASLFGYGDGKHAIETRDDKRWLTVNTYQCVSKHDEALCLMQEQDGKLVGSSIDSVRLTDYAPPKDYDEEEEFARYCTVPIKSHDQWSFVTKNFQYLVAPPLLFNTALILLGMLWIKDKM